MEHFQLHFNPVDYGFEWTSDWYKFDRAACQSAALKARNAKARELKSLGYTVRKWSAPNSLISRGGIGSGRPHIEVICTCYALNADK